MGKRFYKEDLIEKCGPKFDTSTISIGDACRVQNAYVVEYNAIVIDVSDTTIECVHCSGIGHTQRIQYSIDQFVDGSIKFLGTKVNIVNTGKEFKQDVLTLGKCYSIWHESSVYIEGVLIDVNKSELTFGVYCAVKQDTIRHVIPIEIFDDSYQIRQLE